MSRTTIEIMHRMYETNEKLANELREMAELSNKQSEIIRRQTSAIANLRNENEILNRALYSTVKTWLVDDEAWDRDADTERQVAAIIAEAEQEPAA